MATYNEHDLTVAILKGDLELTKTIIESGINPNATTFNEDGTVYSVNPALYQAVNYGTNEIIEYLLSLETVDVNATADYHGTTPLMLAARFKRNLKICRLLIDAKADLNIQQDDGDTALISAAIMAAVYGSKEIVDLLIKSGADLNIQNNAGNTALMEVIYREETDIVDIVKMLLDAGADRSLRNNDGESALDIAYIKGSKKIIELLQAGEPAPALKPSKELLNARLADAILNTNVAIVKEALEEGADPNGTFNNGAPFLIAPLESLWTEDVQLHAEIAELLINAGADVNCTDEHNKSCLELASSHNQTGLVKLIISKQTESGNTFGYELQLLGGDRDLYDPMYDFDPDYREIKFAIDLSLKGKTVAALITKLENSYEQLKNSKNVDVNKPVEAYLLFYNPGESKENCRRQIKSKHLEEKYNGMYGSKETATKQVLFHSEYAGANLKEVIDGIKEYIKSAADVTSLNEIDPESIKRVVDTVKTSIEELKEWKGKTPQSDSYNSDRPLLICAKIVDALKELAFAKEIPMEILEIFKGEKWLLTHNFDYWRYLSGFESYAEASCNLISLLKDNKRMHQEIVSVMV